ncbi:hypothetical protein GECvBN5_gp180 [Salmonella phage GEC_vB_N5]|uniref:Uncharacterized protein n=1 Tax=Salmonella phage GEC_vB_N5 TaxID=2777378 RepID=A0A7S9SS03_9CAUD|nr:hypothetical protein GECvBN5_gp180 [Salmonella phage GEC_vB_N5]
MSEKNNWVFHVVSKCIRRFPRRSRNYITSAVFTNCISESTDFYNTFFGFAINRFNISI